MPKIYPTSEKEYFVPSKINDKFLAEFGTLKEQTCLLNILHYIAKELTKLKEPSRYGYISISSKVLKCLFHGNYSTILNKVLDAGILVRNNKYCNDYDGFCKSYKFGPAISSPLTTFKHLTSDYIPKIHNKTDYNDAVCVQLEKNICKLRIDSEETKKQSYGIQIDAISLNANLKAGFGNCKRGKKVNRTFHRVNTASKEVRALLRLNGNRLTEYDMASAHPFLALDLYEDPNCPESIAYKALLAQDIYSVFQCTRDEAKKALRKFFYSKKHNVRKNGSSSNTVANYFKEHFPILYSTILGSENLAVRLQNLESSLFNDYIVPIASKLGLFYVSVHDGFLADSNENGDYFANLISQTFFTRYGALPRILEKVDAV